MTVAFDLDKASAAITEAAADPFTFTWAGGSYETPNVKSWSVDVVAAAATGNIVGAMEELLGQEQWAEFRKGKPTLGTIEALFAAISKDSGLTPGE